MSLLLEALKKAEKAKEEAQRRSNANPSPGTSPGGELRLQEDASPGPAKPVVTRAELPDISQSLEILSDDIATPKTSANASPRAARAAPPPQARAQAGRDAAQPAAQSAERAADRASARKVFEAKFKEPNPRLPFHLAMGALGIAALCTVGYFWYQLRPAPSLLNANPSPAAAQPVVAAAAPSAQPAPVAAATSQAIPGLPSAAAQPAPAPTPPAATRAPSPTPAVPRPSAVSPAELVARSTPSRAAPASQPTSRVAARAAPQTVETEPVAPVVSRPAPQVNPKVESGYAAFTSGDIARARADYQEALRDEPGNRDALLGMAAVDVRSGLFEAAEGTYLRLLRADPRDAHAQAGLIALRGARMDPLVAESRVKTLLATDPQAHVLHFTLGNQFAQQGRWAEAQQEYFKAFAAEPENADFAYNLAVSLDHLRQVKLALEYYQRAVALAATRGASFDAVAARARIAQLGN